MRDTIKNIKTSKYTKIMKDIKQSKDIKESDYISKSQDRRKNSALGPAQSEKKEKLPEFPKTDFSGEKRAEGEKVYRG